MRFLANENIPGPVVRTLREAGHDVPFMVGRETMIKPSWIPWHQVVRLRDGLRTGELALNEFAAGVAELQSSSAPISASRRVTSVSSCSTTAPTGSG